jgi:hypothetical protein
MISLEKNNLFKNSTIQSYNTVSERIINTHSFDIKQKIAFLEEQLNSESIENIAEENISLKKEINHMKTTIDEAKVFIQINSALKKISNKLFTMMRSLFK